MAIIAFVAAGGMTPAVLRIVSLAPTYTAMERCVLAERELACLAWVAGLVAQTAWCMGLDGRRRRLRCGTCGHIMLASWLPPAGGGRVSYPPSLYAARFVAPAFLVNRMDVFLPRRLRACRAFMASILCSGWTYPTEQRLGSQPFTAFSACFMAFRRDV